MKKKMQFYSKSCSTYLKMYEFDLVCKKNTKWAFRTYDKVSAWGQINFRKKFLSRQHNSLPKIVQYQNDLVIDRYTIFPKIYSFFPVMKKIFCNLNKSSCKFRQMYGIVCFLRFRLLTNCNILNSKNLKTKLNSHAIMIL